MTQGSSGTIYFLIRGGRVKVGFTTNIPRRMAEMQHAEADLLARIDGATLADEKAAHMYLWRWHSWGEWFDASPDCLTAIQELVDGVLDDCAKSLHHTRSVERSLASREAAHRSWANTPDRSARTAPARRALDQKFLDAAGGDVKRAESLRKAHYISLARKSAKVRAARKVGS